MQAGSSSPITPKLQLQLSIPIPSRDPEYYISDGNTVLLVETTLFKVNQSSLSTGGHSNSLMPGSQVGVTFVFIAIISDQRLLHDRSTLTKDKSTFDSMFSLDLDLRSHTGTDPSIGPEGESDDNPIRLQGDSADEFRALLWALYAL